MIDVVRAARRRYLPRGADGRLRPLLPVSQRALALAGLAVALVVVLLIIFLPSRSHAPSTQPVPTSLARVVRTDVIERQQVSGTLGFGGSYTVANGASAGVVTFLPQPGADIGRGQLLYELDRRPVTLFYGFRPAWRDFTLGMSAGTDVRALKENLRALGFTAGGALEVSDRFDVATLAAVEAWQRALGVPVTGTVALGDVVFLPGPARISTTTASVGASIAPGAPVLAATATEPAVLVPLDPGSVAQIRAGDRVLVTMPDNSTVPGHVASIGRVATAPSASDQNGGQSPTPTIPVTISLDRSSRAALDQAPVQVAITAQEDRNVLAVPISALLAQAGGGYAVDVRTRDGSRLVPVTTGLFDDVAGKVEVSGRGLAPGVKVEVPSG